MPTYGYRLMDGMKRDIEGAVPGCTNVVLMRDGSLRVEYADALSVEDKAALDALLTERGFIVLGAGATTLLATGKVCEEVDVITVGGAWQLLGTGFANPGALATDLARCHVLVVGSYQATGATAEIRVVEDNGTTEVEILPPTALADTAGAWVNTLAKLSSVQMRASRNIYRVEARLNGAAALSVRSVFQALREWVVGI